MAAIRTRCRRPEGSSRTCLSNLNLAGAAAVVVRRNHDLFAHAPLGCHRGKKVGVVGLGGLGHMGVKIAHALGAHVVVFSTSPNKKDDALRLGADEVVIRNADEDAETRQQFRLHSLTRSPLITT